MLSNIIFSLIALVIIVIVIYLIYGGIKQRTSINKVPRQLIIGIVIGIILVPISISKITTSVNALVDPTVDLSVTNKHVKITGTNTKGVLNGTTAPDTKVQLKESDGIDNLKKTTKSDNNGKFTFRKLPDDTSFKLTVIDKKSNPTSIKIEVGDIPDSAYTKLKIDGGDEVNDLNIKNDASDKNNISGTSEPSAKIKAENDDGDVVGSVIADQNGKWQITLDGPAAKNKKKMEYDLTAKVKNKLESDISFITIKNTTYDPAKKKESKQTKSTDDKESTKESQSDETNSPSDGFKLDLNTYLSNKYPDVSMSYSKGKVTLTVPGEVALLNKTLLKSYFKPINDRIFLFANANDMKSVPTFIAQTPDDTVVARTSLFGGVKVYVQK